LGFGIRKKIKYISACFEEPIFKLKRKNGYGKYIYQEVVEDNGVWFCNQVDLKDVIWADKAQIIKDADLVTKQQFDILGTGLQYWNNPIRWHLDIKSGREWPVCYYKKLYNGNLTGVNFSDVKIPWELSRFQHLIPLIKAFIITGDDKYASEAVNQIDNWIEDNPFCYGVNWTCAMEVAIRACNWIWGLWFFKQSEAWAKEFRGKFLLSLWQHGKYIEDNLEYKGKFSTNHYLANVVGLLFFGIMFPCFKEAKEWKDFGKKELWRCMEEMVYPDGVNFENSTAYHRLVLEFFTYSAVLCRKNGIELPQSFWDRLEIMFEFVMHCIRPDGRMPMIGDSDDGRFFILTDNYNWDRWDFQYLLSIGAVLFKRKDFKIAAGKCHSEILWMLGEEGLEKWKTL
jgi:hypothetical protein